MALAQGGLKNRWLLDNSWARLGLRKDRETWNQGRLPAAHSWRTMGPLERGPFCARFSDALTHQPRLTNRRSVMKNSKKCLLIIVFPPKKATCSTRSSQVAGQVWVTEGQEAEGKSDMHSLWLLCISLAPEQVRAESACQQIRPLNFITRLKADHWCLPKYHMVTFTFGFLFTVDVWNY